MRKTVINLGTVMELLKATNYNENSIEGFVEELVGCAVALTLHKEPIYMESCAIQSWGNVKNYVSFDIYTAKGDRFIAEVFSSKIKVYDEVYNPLATFTDKQITETWLEAYKQLDEKREK